jgi:hypothetical protein
LPVTENKDCLLNIAFAEKLADFAVNNKGAKDTASLVPNELKTEENLVTLRSNGARHLVGLCTLPGPH